MPRMNVNTAISMPVNYLPPIDDTDFKSREQNIVFNQAGLEIYFMFLTFAGVVTKTQITPTTGGGDYDWTSLSNGMYTIGIPAAGGASVDNDTLGYGWITGIATGVLVFSGPIIEFRATEIPTAIENRQEMDNNSTELAKIGTIPALDGAGQTIGAAIAKLADDNGGADFDAADDSLERIANTAPLGTPMRGTDGANTTKTGFSLSTAGILAIWHQLTAAIVTAGSIGKLLVDNINATISSRPTAVQNRQEMDNNSTQLAAIKAKTDNLPSAIKKNTALNNFTFIMVSSVDHVTATPLLVVTAQRSIDGAAFANTANAVVEISDGAYKINLAAADLNGNEVTLKFTAAGADPRFIVLPKLIA